MNDNTPTETTSIQRIRDLPRNGCATSLTSFFMDISSEMVLNVLPPITALLMAFAMPDQHAPDAATSNATKA